MYSEYTNKNGDTCYEIFNAPRTLFYSIHDELVNNLGAEFEKIEKSQNRIASRFMFASNLYNLVWEEAEIDSLQIISITDEGDYLLKQEIGLYLDDILFD